MPPTPSTAIVTAEPAREQGIALGLLTGRTAADIVAGAGEIARVAADIIEQRRLYVTIDHRKHVRCEGWTTMVAMLGVTPHEVAVEEHDGIFVATVELRRVADGGVVARASAECGAPDEVSAKTGKPLWANRPRYARRSMALTRATAKACRLAFSWILVLAKFEPTPAEEMDFAVGDGEADPLTAAAPASRAPRAARRPRTPPTPASDSATSPALITDDQARAFWKRAREQGWVADELRIWLQEAFGIGSIRDIPAARYPELCDAVGQPHAPGESVPF